MNIINRLSDGLRKALGLSRNSRSTNAVSSIRFEELDRKMSSWIESQAFIEPQTRDEILHLFDATPTELAEYCRKRYRMTFASIRKRLRIDEAMRLIREQPDLPITKVGEMAGIPDKSNFRRQFESIVGCSPYQYRKNFMK